ncbi:MAG: enoyl-CoA hydratase/isomerase family protein [Desulfarculus sp.]|nr:MAG: enoyl-CoA hydratase/isomerase family protein [Desulfarculus sp.]
MSEQTVLIDDQGPVRLLTLNRPQRLNALNPQMGREMQAALAQAATDEQVRAVVITGAGRGFSAGADLSRFQAFAQGGQFLEAQRFTGLDFPRAFATFPKPLIAAINGPAVGWGFTMPLMCDIRLASAQAMFSCGFVRVGVTPEFGSSHLLPALIGLSRALELVLTARRVSPEEAKAMGLVAEVCEPERLLPRALELAAEIAAFPAPAVQMAKALLQHGAGASLEQTMAYEIQCFRAAMQTPEHREAVERMLAAIKAK